MDAVVQLIRNAFCCVKDLQLFASVWPTLYDPSVTRQYYEFPEPQSPTPLDVLICICQLFAFIQTTRGGFTLLVESWGKVRLCECGIYTT
jgi:hypothetical protein